MAASQCGLINKFSKPIQTGAVIKRCNAAAILRGTGANLSYFSGNLSCFRVNLGLNCRFEGTATKRRFSAQNVRAAVQIESEVAAKSSGKSKRALRVGLICGGPSAERGISLNSARSVLDHIQGEDISVSCYYIDCELNAYAISSAQMYSNTPADFDFKLDSLAQGFKSMPEFMEHLTSSTDIVFPLIHGRFGEDGGIQDLLEKTGIPFVGTGSKEASRAFDKYNASMELNNYKFVTIPNFLVQQGSEADKNELSKWFISNGLDVGSGKVVVKPARAGSSIGVSVAFGVDDALMKANKLITEGVDVRIIIEIFLEGGREFTAIVLDLGCGSDSSPVTLLPTEVELHFHGSSNRDESEGIFNYRRKYLPTRQVTYHTPPRFSVDVIDHIRQGAAMLFRCLGLRDFARIDGWFLPSSKFSSVYMQNEKENLFGKLESGTIIFTDINLISGMEQTSFLFQQAAKVGLSHAGVLRTIVRRACMRFPELHSYVVSAHNYERLRSSGVRDSGFEQRQKVFVIFGGGTSERQVSLMSGTNVWLNLRSCKECQTNNVNSSDHSKHIEAFESLAGKGDAEQLKGLLDHVSAGSTENLSPIVLSADPEKAHRTAVHNFFKTNLSFLVTDTIEGADPNAKCVRVRYYSNKNGAHGRDKDCRRQVDKKRKNWGSKQDRNAKRGKCDGSLSEDFDQAFDSRGADEWPEDRGKFLRFHLCKENKDTQEALMVIGKMLGVQVRSFGFAGTKDKRAVTTQRVTVFKQKASRLAALNKRLYGIKVGDFCYVGGGLVLGQLSGNRFTITLRGVVAESHDIIKEAAEGLGKNGFINYFGLQRFGSGSVPTHTIGAALLRGEWKTAVDLILDPREEERSDIKEAREYYKSTMDFDGTLKRMPRYLVAERAILACLKKNPNNYLQAICSIPRTLRMMYVHSYQSYLWNHAASARVQKYGVEKVVEGDIVYCKETEVDKQNPNKEAQNEASDGDARCEFDVIDEATESDLSQEIVNVAVVANADDIALGKYTIDDVVLPLPGSRIIYPANDIAETFHKLAGKDSINLRDSSHNVKEYSIMSMTGGYRRLIQKPIDYTWNIIKYKEPTQPLVETDLDAIAKCCNGDNEIPHKPSNEISNEHEKSSTSERKQNSPNNVAGGHAEEKLKTDVKEVNLNGGSEPTLHTALQISFTLPTSCYATMAIRELLKTSISTTFHKTLND